MTFGGMGYTEPVEIVPCDDSWPGYEEPIFER